MGPKSMNLIGNPYLLKNPFAKMGIFKFVVSYNVIAKSKHNMSKILPARPKTNQDCQYHDCRNDYTKSVF